MKRKFAWLALPLILFISLANAQSRVKYPPLTKEDLKIRKLLSKATAADFEYDPANVEEREQEYKKINRKELNRFVRSFHLSKEQKRGKAVGRGIVTFIWRFPNEKVGEPQEAIFTLAAGTDGGVVEIWVDGREASYYLHPVTTKRWMELLLNHPRIGPELRKRMKQ